MNIKIVRRLALTLLALLLWGQVPAHSQQRIRLGISAASLGFLPTVLAEKKGFYSKHGINSEHVMIPCAIATNALLSGDLDYAVCTGPGIAGAIKGLPIKLVMTTQDKL
ncbi:MAG TPA: ABC transporter substrate-binding protein, partial [Candidatus Binatia bacterium]